MDTFGILWIWIRVFVDDEDKFSTWPKKKFKDAASCFLEHQNLWHSECKCSHVHPLEVPRRTFWSVTFWYWKAPWLYSYLFVGRHVAEISSIMAGPGVLVAKYGELMSETWLGWTLWGFSNTFKARKNYQLIWFHWHVLELLDSATSQQYYGCKRVLIFF